MSDDELSNFSALIEQEDLLEIERVLTEHPEIVNLYYGNESWIHIAAQEGQLDVLRLLISRGADPNLRDEDEPTVPLRKATIRNHVEVARLLLENGADPKVEGLVTSAIVNNKPRALEMLKLLDQYGADLHSVYTHVGTKKPMNALALAIEGGNSEIVNYLKSRGCVLPGKTPEKPKSRSPFADVIDFFGSQFGPVKKESLIEIVPTTPAIAVHVVPASEGRDYVILFTTGMSAHAMTVPKGSEEFRYAELFIQLPAKWPLSKQALEDRNYFWPIHWLRWVAKYPHQNQTWLGAPATIVAEEEPPQPFAPKIKFTSMLLLADKQLESETGKTIKLYRMAPLYTEERQLEIDKGIAALMRAFDKHNVPFIVDLKRKNVAK